MKTKSYDRKADCYSLGVLLLEMFRDHDISFATKNNIYECFRHKGEVEPKLAKKMPVNVKILIEKLISIDPE